MGKEITLIDIGSGVKWFYPPHYRCAVEPKYYHANSVYMTDQGAFTDYKLIKDVKVGDKVYVESPDVFCYVTDQGDYAFGKRVWRLSEIIETGT